MRVTVFENSVLKVISDSLPKSSSIAKIVKATGSVRADIEETLESFKKLQLVNVFSNDEVYLLKAGREYLGIPSEVAKRELSKVPVRLADQKEHPSYSIAKPLPEDKAGAKAIISDSPSISSSLDALSVKLNSKINDKELKTQVLQRLSEMLSDDIAKVLLAVRDDLDSFSK